MDCTCDNNKINTGLGFDLNCPLHGKHVEHETEVIRMPLTQMEKLAYAAYPPNLHKWADNPPQFDDLNAPHRSIWLEGYKANKVNETVLLALEKLVADVRSKPNDTRYATHIKIAEAAIADAKKLKP